MRAIRGQFDRFADRVRKVAETGGNDLVYAGYERRTLVETYIGEAASGLALIENDLHPGLRLLEIGSGSGLLASFLAEQGYDITGLEPGAGDGFRHMRAMFDIVKSQLVSRPDFDLTRASITELSPRTHGLFDLIFSVNVLEHIPPIREGFQAMASVLSPNGTMLHTCPNYSFPYEPHFVIPLVPFSPRLSKMLFLKPEMEKSLPGIWDDLNWISASMVRQFVQENGLSVTFEKSAMVASLRRLQTDPAFASRHGKKLTIVSRVLGATGILNLLDMLPADFSTPMTFRVIRA
jgi:2-polyprenyl-3-methyl-5-hydroxy-6-metoxy-1,4-benzoquinol methylase